MTVFDEIAETDGDNEWKAWLEKVFTSRDEIVTFVASRREGGGAGEVVRYLWGSFNLNIYIRFSNRGPNTIIRFPKPGLLQRFRRNCSVRSCNRPFSHSPFSK